MAMDYCKANLFQTGTAADPDQITYRMGLLWCTLFSQELILLNRTLSSCWALDLQIALKTTLNASAV